MQDEAKGHRIPEIIINCARIKTMFLHTGNSKKKVSRPIKAGLFWLTQPNSKNADAGQPLSQAF